MWLNNVRAVLPDRILKQAAIKIENDLIAEISEKPVEDAQIDGHGLLLMPGFIDMHGDMIEREIEPRPKVRMPFELGLRDLDGRLKMAGVTTAYAAVSFNPNATSGRLRSQEHSRAMLQALKKMRQSLSIDHKVHARFEISFPKAFNIIQELIADGTVDLVSLTDHTPGQGQYRDIEQLIRNKQAEGMSRQKAEDLIANHINKKREDAGDILATIRTMSDVCAKAGVTLASHDDDTPEKAELMHNVGAAISEFPVTLEAAEAARSFGMMTVMGAPNALRGESYSGNLSAREAHQQGILDILAADYHPSAILPAVLVLAGADPQGLVGTVRLATANPAKALGLTDRGEILPGKRADLILVDDKGLGHVRTTFCRGKMVYSDRESMSS